MPLIPALRKQRDRWISEIKASMVYRASSRKPALRRETLSPKNGRKEGRKEERKEEEKVYLLDDGS